MGNDEELILCGCMWGVRSNEYDSGRDEGGDLEETMSPFAVRKVTNSRGKESEKDCSNPSDCVNIERLGRMSTKAVRSQSRLVFPRGFCDMARREIRQSSFTKISLTL